MSLRNEAYAGISPLATRVYHAMATWDASEKTLEDAIQIRRKLRYHSPDKPKQNVKTETPEPKGNRAVHLNFEALASNFKKLIECVNSMPEYAPNEQDLTIEALHAYHAQLLFLNNEVISREVNLKQLRLKRNELLFGTKGIYGVANKVKHYVATAFRQNSAEFRSIKGIPFMKK